MLLSNTSVLGQGPAELTSGEGEPIVLPESINELITAPIPEDCGGKGAMKRLKLELKDITSSPPSGSSYCALPIDHDLFQWEAVIVGPRETCYHGGLFFLSLSFSHDYPFNPPSIIFKTPIFHTNINENGAISLDILKSSNRFPEGQWSPALTASKCLASIIELLEDPGPDGFGNRINLFHNDRAKYFATVREYTQKYAMV
ncbi:UBC-like protein [Xylariaceae sp. AK1471]|nr:UBC-like protein [Xylariaceae sp. AK1471]